MLHNNTSSTRQGPIKGHQNYDDTIIPPTGVVLFYRWKNPLVRGQPHSEQMSGDAGR